MRLWALVSGVLQYADYTYTEANFQMLTPTPGSTIPAGPATFTWTPFTGATQYQLWFGSAPGAYNLLYDFATGTSYTATLPVTGATLYVRLWARVGGVWQSVDYTYTH